MRRQFRIALGLLSFVVAVPAQFVQQGSKLVGSGALGGFSYCTNDWGAQGTAVAASSDGNTAVIGSASDDNGTGAVWVFTRTGSAWGQQAKLVGSGTTNLQNYSNLMGYWGTCLGASVGVSGDGNTIIAGGPHDNGQFGGAWVFIRANRAWTQQGSRLPPNLSKTQLGFP